MPPPPCALKGLGEEPEVSLWRVHWSLLALFGSMLASGSDIPERAGGERAAAAIPGDADPLCCLWA